MSKLSDGIPEAIPINERSKRTTTEFCSEHLEGLRCMLVKGHPGPHESLANAGITRWPLSRAS